MVSKLVPESELVDFGHHLILGISGPTLSEDDKRVLELVRPVGVLLLARNFRHGHLYELWLESLKHLLADIKKYAGRAAMFISLDHEGGGVVRTPNPITRFPYAAVLRERAEAVAHATAKELLSIGVNVSWAPVADVHSNPHNPIIGVRAFSSDPQEAAEYASAYARGLSKAGVIGCAKHFPGHGDTSTDSHLELPVLPISRETLVQRELIPFRLLCSEKIPMVMTAHVLFPAIDPVQPATFSRTLIAELLRGELQYEGVIVSDDLEMKAISRRIEEEDEIAEPFNAGCDMAIVARYLQPKIDHVLAMAQTFSRTLGENPSFAENIATSRRRIDTLLKKTPMPTVLPLSKEVLEQHARLAIEVALK